jgi:hypothetical protein
LAIAPSNPFLPEFSMARKHVIATGLKLGLPIQEEPEPRIIKDYPHFWASSVLK